MGAQPHQTKNMTVLNRAVLGQQAWPQPDAAVTAHHAGRRREKVLDPAHRLQAQWLC